MNHRETTPVPPGMGLALPCLAVLLLLLLAIVRVWSRPMLPPLAGSRESEPYLGALGAPPLRFQELAPPPDLVTRPAAAAPPHPRVTEEPVAIAAVEPRPSPASVAAPEPPHLSTDAVTPPAADAPAPAPTPPPILRDEIHPQTRPEDFLPFFQIPATQAGDMSIVVPVPRAPAAPAPLPTSSATYTQSPR